MIRRKKEGIGLDIGASAVKLVVLSRSGAKVRLARHGIRELPPEAIVGGEIMDRELVVRAISELAGELGTQGRYAATAVSGRGIIVKRIATERVAKEALRDAVFWAAEEHIPHDINEMAMDFHVLRPAGKSKTTEVLLVAVRKETVLDLAQLVKEGGMGASVVDINQFAVLNMLRYSEEISKNEIFAAVDIGAESTCISVSSESEPLLSSQVSAGTRNFAQALQKSFSVSESEAQQILSGENGRSRDEVVNVITPALEEISASLERAISYLSDMGTAEKFDRLFLCGGGSRTAGLDGYFSEKFPVPVKVADAARRMGALEPATGSRLAVAIGLALRETA